MFIVLGRFAYVTHCSLGVGGDVVWGVGCRNYNLCRFAETRPISSGSYLLGPSLGVNHMTDSWPYPLAQEIWDQLDNTFSTEEDYEDLQIYDFVVLG